MDHPWMLAILAQGVSLRLKEQLSMSKYGKLSQRDGHSKWFLQKTLVEHDQTMDHPWMQMIYRQTFTVKQYCAWLAREHASFQKLEELLIGRTKLDLVHSASLLR